MNVQLWALFRVLTVRGLPWLNIWKGFIMVNNIPRLFVHPAFTTRSEDRLRSWKQELDWTLWGLFFRVPLFFRPSTSFEEPGYYCLLKVATGFAVLWAFTPIGIVPSNESRPVEPARSKDLAAETGVRRDVPFSSLPPSSCYYVFNPEYAVSLAAISVRNYGQDIDREGSYWTPYLCSPVGEETELFNHYQLTRLAYSVLGLWVSFSWVHLSLAV